MTTAFERLQTQTNKPSGSIESSPRQLPQQLHEFVRSLGSVLADVSALEVNTMVVEQINGNKFIPWEVYRDIYPISRVYLEQQGYHPTLHKPYLDLRSQLELQYSLLLTDPSSAFYDPSVLENIREMSPILTDPTIDSMDLPTRLPDPINPTDAAEVTRVRQLLNSGSFLCHLRKISELKAALDNRNRRLIRQAISLTNTPSSQAEDDINPTSTETVLNDVIYAQTVIQLDGDIVNRYAEELFRHPYKESILEIHRASLETSEKQWRGLMGFIIEIIQSTINRGNLGSQKRRARKKNK
ncbi:hypothetical protein Lepto7376_0770 [[Leptolyngbya] sp. PCC 7376]|uniref:hypothetical protein n=1 Tax=[Leptolyngbya] sp. PCC 7376 TaxID=111781 RepID=UPI00029F22EF|nr:hypothetical protein [[Leptolyngbya] sp. PCC 7376]AFY37167.1 hypothetical protein Lepto7376_0770 [[Leptolyngbya] sp. PCC 7376]